ncbi:MAG: riboflavin synthase [Nitrososphaerales archaeon]
MFTGIIHGLGRVESIRAVKGDGGGKAAVMNVNLGKLARGLKVGDSVSINGACLTVVRLRRGRAGFEMIGETMKKTALGRLTEGERVNLERSLRFGDPMDGHFVMGHVDCTGTILQKAKQKNQTKLWVRIEDRKMIRYIVPKGSIAIDGVSLTVVDVLKDRISVALIPHTLTVTTLGTKGRGSRVNVEIDLLGKYASKLLTGSR